MHGEYFHQTAKLYYNDSAGLFRPEPGVLPAFIHFFYSLAYVQEKHHRPEYTGF